ncbi:NEDD8-activating enzyme E1 regulatory subunit [Cytospora mali]|uniref:NEDD8-activating enzyme E1 regulatory subunit n=1 Tax=Cytospora mali TaxID=578113 RepID=A0A194UU27_CYTMA|nr:NEDD8-activating enzyme E1 regulatory subunit [Valsa mali var. pyri (nom. inval.)]
MTEIVTTQTPPILHGPSEKERKYDRQLRLWAASGQAALESANILLFNTGSGTVGVETLKNLVLPGIGSFTIVDDAVVTEADLGLNFFLDENCLGKSRAQSCTELLLELNPEVQGNWLPKNQEPLNLEKVFSTSPTFTMILYTFPIKPGHLKLLQDYGGHHLTPLVAIHSAGLYSYFRISLPGAFPIVDTHPEESATTDLRLLSSWPELQNFARDLTKDIDTMNNHEHGHIPYVVILLHYLEKWKETHGDYPKNFGEKKEFRKMVADGARSNPEGGEENFDEAVAAVVKTIMPTSLPSSLKDVFNYAHNDPIEQKSSFWIIAEAVKRFYEKHNCLPLPGNVPDMKAQSKVYIQLQGIYKAKARRDVAEVLETARQIPGGEGVDSGEVELFCKNAAFVKLINGGASGDDRLAKVVEEELENDANAEAMMMPLSLIPIYLALSATSQNAQASSEEILQTIGNIVPDATSNERLVKASQEVARAGGGELHNTSALTGGMVAQEVIKIITKQYIPVDNTCIFDGISSRCQVLRL